MACQHLEECFRESIGGKNKFFDKERCTSREEWVKCPVFLKKKNESIDRGVSSIIAAIFMVTIILFISFNVFTFTLFKNTQFQDAVDAQNQMDVEQYYERIGFSDVSFTRQENDWILVDAQLTNDGSVSVRIVSLWVLQGTTDRYGHVDLRDAMLELGLGKTSSFTAPVAAMGFVDGEPVLTGWPVSSGKFTAWFITARGNRIPIEDKVVYAEVAQGMGSLVLDFDNFRYFIYTDRVNGILADYPEGTVSFNVPQKEYVAFGVYLTNEDPKQRAITLDEHSLFWQPGAPGGLVENRWYIVRVVVDGEEAVIDDEYSLITIEYGDTAMLVFASGKERFFAAEDTASPSTVATFLLLHGDIGSDSFAQNIPYVSLFYEII